MATNAKRRTTKDIDRDADSMVYNGAIPETLLNMYGQTAGGQKVTAGRIEGDQTGVKPIALGEGSVTPGNQAGVPGTGVQTGGQTAGQAGQGGAQDGALSKYLQILQEARDAQKGSAQAQYDAQAAAINRNIGDAEAANAQRGQALSAERERALREASAMYDKMAKYLPQLQRAQGLAGSGLANEQAVNVYNSILNRQVGANAAYNQGMRESEDALAAYRREAEAQRAAAEADRVSAAAGADVGYKQAEAQYQLMQEQYAREDAQNAQALNALTQAMDSRWARLAGEDGLVSPEDYEAWAAQVEAQRASLPEGQRQLLDYYLAAQQSYVRKPEEQDAYEMENGQRAIFSSGLMGNGKNLKPGNNFKVTANGETLNVELGNKAESVPSGGERAREGEIFKSGDALYMKYAGGYYEVRARANTYKTDFEKLKDLYR